MALGGRVVRIGTAVAIAIAVPAVGATSAKSAPPTNPCAGDRPGLAATLFDRVPQLMSTRMSPTRDGGAVIAFALFRSSADFPRNRFFVTRLDARGCVRWRVALPGGWPIARPVQASDGSVVAASAADNEPGAAGGLRVYSLSDATGRVLWRSAFSPATTLAGMAPTLIPGQRGELGVVTGGLKTDRRGTFRLSTILLARRPGTARWSRHVIDRGRAPVAVAARPDGRIVVAVVRARQLWVRAATLGGAAGPAVAAGPLGGNYRSAALALGANGAVAAAWQSSTYGTPWRVRASVRRAGARRFGRFAQIGFTPGVANTLFESSPPGVRLDARGRASVGFELLAPPGGPRTLCATATAAGRFAAARRVAAGGAPPALDRAAVTFGAGDGALAIGATSADLTGFVLARVGPGCRPLATVRLDPRAGVPAQALVDRRGRAWLVGQPCCLTDLDSLREPITLTIAPPVP
jgi:hypothetical protein